MKLVLSTERKHVYCLVAVNQSGVGERLIDATLWGESSYWQLSVKDECFSICNMSTYFLGKKEKLESIFWRETKKKQPNISPERLHSNLEEERGKEERETSKTQCCSPPGGHKSWVLSKFGWLMLNFWSYVDVCCPVNSYFTSIKILLPTALAVLSTVVVDHDCGKRELL